MFIVPITKMEPSLTLEELKKSEGSQLPSEGKEFGSFLRKRSGKPTRPCRKLRKWTESSLWER